jgi:enoyl-CoA hydratase/carnithine racemase
MKTITVEYQNQVAILRLNRGPTNPLNLGLVTELTEILATLKSRSDVRSLVLTSVSDKFFSIGFDIPALIDLPRKEFATIYQAFNQLCLDIYTFPKPTVAAIKGHAIAGGTILALCCDYRFIAEGHKLMGLNEIKLGVPVPYLADLILGQVVGSRSAREIVESGDLYPPDQLANFGLVDEVVLLNHVLPKAIEKASSLGDHLQDAYALVKNNRVETIVQLFNQHSKEKEKQFINSWYSPAARERLKTAMEKF